MPPPTRVVGECPAEHPARRRLPAIASLGFCLVGRLLHFPGRATTCAQRLHRVRWVLSFAPQRGQTRFFSFRTNLVRGRDRIFVYPSLLSAVFFNGRRICAGAIARTATPQNLVGALVPMCRGRYGVFRSTYEIPIIGDRQAWRQRTLAMVSCRQYLDKAVTRGSEYPVLGFSANSVTGFSAKITRFSVKNIPFPRLTRSGHSFFVIQAALAFRIPLRRPNWRPNSETVCPFTMLRTKADQTNQSEQTDRDRKSG